MKTLVLPAVAASLFVAILTIGVSAEESDFERWRELITEGETEQAEAIVDEIEAIVGDQAVEGRSIGVASLIGS